MELPTNFKMTPMYEQYLAIKKKYPDALLFYRMGDFYELFFDDARIASSVLQLTLTSRSKEENAVPMCGVPWHAGDSYIRQLTGKGYSVAICEQVEDPRQAKGLVKREVVSVITPGTQIDEGALNPKSHNYLGAFIWNPEQEAGGFAWADASTGYWTGLQSKKRDVLWQWVEKIAPKELLVADQEEVPKYIASLGETRVVYQNYRSHFDLKRAQERIMEAQQVSDLAALGLDNRPQLAQACGAVLTYLTQTQLQNPGHLQPFKPMDLGNYLIIDEVSERNLELFRRLDGRKGAGTLWQVLDETISPMGGRLLEERMRYPWRDTALIQANLDVVEYLADSPRVRENIRQALAQIQDLERLLTKVILGRSKPRDLSAIRQSLNSLPQIRKAAEQQERPYKPSQEEFEGDYLPRALANLLGQWDDMANVAAKLNSALNDDLPVLPSDGGLFRTGYHAELDRYLDLLEHGTEKLQALLEREKAACGLPWLKLAHNKVFGYYFELSKSKHSGEPPAHFIRRQTVANAERYVTEELKQLEEDIVRANELRIRLELELYAALREDLAAEHQRFAFMSQLLAQVDLWQCLAEVACRRNWTKPEVNQGHDLEIIQGRHPAVEAVLGQARFIPNDLRFDQDKRLLLITGPNMAGKSTILRQTAIICILAQMGSFVPAAGAKLGVADRVFSRVGASDNLAQGQSTFMVEMMETARILRQAGRSSLIILDEIGRGTSTFDGLSLAWAIVEDLALRRDGQLRVLFATHYHELTSLQGKLDGLYNMNVDVSEHNRELVFTHQLIPGPTNRSYGIEVAKLAGLPRPVVQRATEILEQLERSRGGGRDKKQVHLLSLPGLGRNTPPGNRKDKLLDVLNRLDPGQIGPEQALAILKDWKKEFGGPND